jgi:SAM-dependent methyltransferase
MDRLSIVRYFLKREQRGLEIGASFSPIAPKSDGWNVETIDHATREALIEKFLPHGVDVSKIEDVDWVWCGQPIDVLLGESRWGTYDYCIASHVIEHIPDLLEFLNNLERLLRPQGVLSLVIPDKRHCFDFFKPLTSTADVLYAHERKLQRHTKKTAFEEIAYATARAGLHIWDERHAGSLSLIHTLDQAMEHFRNCDESNTSAYTDYHCSFFVPASFELLIEELAALGLTRFQIVKQFPGSGCEFYVALRKADVNTVATQAPHTREARRLELLKRIAREVASEATVD